MGLGIYNLVHSNVRLGKEVIKTKWIFNLKADMSVKARPVVQGKGLVPGVGRDAAFTPVYRFQRIRMVLALAAGINFVIFQLDLQTAFLIADVEKDVYVKMAHGYATTYKAGEPQVMRFIKRLYGLPNSPLNW